MHVYVVQLKDNRYDDTPILQNKNDTDHFTEAMICYLCYIRAYLVLILFYHHVTRG